MKFLRWALVAPLFCATAACGKGQLGAQDSRAATLAAYDEGIFDVTDFGAKCDGATDDRNAIQAALDAAGKVKGTGAVVLLAQGTCVIGSSLTVHTGTALVGRGIYSTNLSPRNGHRFTMIGVDGQNVEVRDFRVTDFSNKVHPREVFVVADLTDGTNGGASGLTLRNLQLEKIVSGVYSRSGLLRAYDVRITGQKGDVGRGYALDLGKNEIVEIDGGMVVDNAVGIDILSGSTFDMRDLELMHNRQGVWVHPRKGQTVFSIKTRNVWFDNSREFGLILDGTAGIITRVDLFGSWFSSSGRDGIWADGTVSGLHVSGASIYDNKGNGININGRSRDSKGALIAKALNYTGLNINGSVIAGSGQNGIRIGEGVDGFVISGNTIGPAADFGGNRIYGIDVERPPGGPAKLPASKSYIISGNMMSGNIKGSMSMTDLLESCPVSDNKI